MEIFRDSESAMLKKILNALHHSAQQLLFNSKISCKEVAHLFHKMQNFSMEKYLHTFEKKAVFA